MPFLLLKTLLTICYRRYPIRFGYALFPVNENGRDVVKNWAPALTVPLSPTRSSHDSIERAGDGDRGLVHDVGVHHCRGQHGMSKQLLHLPDVVAGFQYVGSETVTEGVA